MDYEQLETPQERARFLLEAGVTAQYDPFQERWRARAGNSYLPFNGATETLAIRRATDKLEQVAGAVA